MSLLSRFFNRPLPTVPPETPAKKAQRDFTQRLIEEHTKANNRGRERVVTQARANTLRYLNTLTDAMNIIGDRQ